VIEITSISEYIRENNVESGIIVNILISFVLYISTWYIYAGFVLYGDLQFLVGSIVGVYITIKNKKPDQSILKYGIITGIIGGVFSSILVALFDWILYSLRVGFNIFSFFILLLLMLLSGLAVGLLGGAGVGAYYMYKEVKGEKILKRDNGLDEDFFKDLIEDKKS
jgi:hypothetical protein